MRDVHRPSLIAICATLLAVGIFTIVLLLTWEQVEPFIPGLSRTPKRTVQPRTPRHTAEQLRAHLLPGLPQQLTKMAPPAHALRVRRKYMSTDQRKRPAGWKPVAIVLHGTGSGLPGSEFSSPAALRRYFIRSQRPASSHYAIGRDGSVLQMVGDGRAAFHVSADGWNEISIGIELLNDNTGRQAFPPDQIRSLRLLVQELGLQYDIPVEAVVRHRTVQPKDRSDPARNFPWKPFIRSLTQT